MDFRPESAEIFKIVRVICAGAKFFEILKIFCVEGAKIDLNRLFEEAFEDFALACGKHLPF